MEVLFFQLAASWRNGSCVGGNKSRMPGGFITQTVPGLFFFSARRCRNIHYMHEEFSLAARIDLASPVPQQVLITSTVFFLKSVMRCTLCWVSCQTQVCMMLKVKSSMDKVSVHFLRCSFIMLRRLVYAIASSLLLNKHVMSALSHPLYSIIVSLHNENDSFSLKQKSHVNTSSCLWMTGQM